MNRFTLLPLAFAVATSLNAAAGSSSEVKTYPATGGTAAAMSPNSSSRENVPSNATGSNTTAGSMNGSNLTELPAKTASDPLQAEDKSKSKTKVKTAKKKTQESGTNKPEPYVLDGTSPTAPQGTASSTRPDNSQGTTSMTTPQPGRGGPTPPGVTDPPAPPPATSPSPAPSGGGNGPSK